MSFSINTNTASLTAARALYKNTFNLQKSVERMSTGLRVNRAGDDAASAAIADTMEAEIQGLGKAAQNAQDGLSMAQTIDGGLSAVQSSLQRIRELVVQGTNGTLSADEKDSIQREINEQVLNISDLSNTVKFNGVSLLKNSTASVNGNNTRVLTMQTGAYDSETTSLGVGNNSTLANTGIYIDVNLDRVADDTEHGSLHEGTTAGFALNELKISGATVAAQGGATAATSGPLAEIDTMIGNISRMRGSVGAFSNALEAKIEFINLHKENVTASKSRMVDLDVAAESAKLVKSQILQKAATSMLSQANSLPAAALDLLP